MLKKLKISQWYKKSLGNFTNLVYGNTDVVITGGWRE